MIYSCQYEDKIHMLQVRGQTSKSVTLKRRINRFCSVVIKVVCTAVTKIKMNRSTYIFLVFISLGISVFCIKKKYTHAVNHEQYPIVVRLTKGRFLTPFRMGIFGAAHRWGGKKLPLLKTCHTYPTMMKLGTIIPYLKKIQKICKSRETPPEFC